MNWPRSLSPGGAENCPATLLAQAVKKSNVELAKLLLDAGAKVTTVDADGFVPLHWATANDADPALKTLLLAHGADTRTPRAATAKWSRCRHLSRAARSWSQSRCSRQHWHDFAAAGGCRLEDFAKGSSLIEKTDSAVSN